ACQLELAQTQMLQKKYADAEPHLREWLVASEQTQPDDPQPFTIMSLLGARLLGQKKDADAEPLLTRGDEGIKKSQAPSAAPNPTLTLTLERLVQLYDAWEKKDVADRWRKELEDTKKADAPKKK